MNILLKAHNQEMSRHNFFPGLPAYQPPKSGLVSRVPTWAIPYAELMRLHKPAGYYAFLFPHLYGTLLAASSPFHRPPELHTLIHVVGVHAISNIFLRGAACTYNDALDKEYDRRVERCRHRPVARGAVSANAAFAFAIAQTIIWAALLLTTMPREVRMPAMLFVAIMVVYPLCKRWTNFPQVVLGFCLALGQGIGIGSLGIEVFAWTKHSQKAEIVGLAAMYLGNVVNAMVYDTVYAHQDLRDDLKAGVASMAIACHGWTKQWLSLLSLLEIGMLVVAGSAIGYEGLYWPVAVGGTAMALIWMLIDWDPNKPAACWKWFCWTIWLTGGTICSGLFSEYLWWSTRA